MKILQNTAFTALFLVTFFSCKKEALQSPNMLSVASNSSQSAAALPKSKWLGSYVEGNGLYIDSVKDNTFISNGVAKLANSPYSYYYTSVELFITNRTIPGDSIKFESKFKNPSSGGITDYDANLFITGTKGVAHVTFIGYRPEFTSIGLGAVQLTNVPELIHVFENFTTVALQIKDNTISVYTNDILTKSLAINNEKVGKIKSIKLAFKGSGTIDWVKLFNSYSGAQIMQEDFDSNRSHVIWY